LNKDRLNRGHSSAQINGKIPGRKKKTFLKQVQLELYKNWGVYLLLLPAFVWVIIFCYIPMYGVVIAFKDFNPIYGILRSPWAGFKHFERFLGSYDFIRLISNTLTLSIYQLVAGFPIPIIFALCLNYISNNKLRKTVQTVSYAPHFISTVVIVGMMSVFLSPSKGLVNILLGFIGVEPISFMGRPDLFKHLYVWSGIWQETGWSGIIYIASLANISPELHEAAVIDGATKLKRIWYVDIPGIMPTAIILLIMRTGQIMGIGFEKAFLMQNNLNLVKSEIISTYVYKVGLLGAQFSFSAAVGLFNSVVSMVLLLSVNYIARKRAEISLI